VKKENIKSVNLNKIKGKIKTNHSGVCL